MWPRRPLLGLNREDTIECCPPFNSLAPGKFEWNFRYVIFKQILVIDGWGISCEIALIWMSSDFTDDQSTLVQVMAWCRQATSHYLSQCWPRSLSPNGVTRPQWVKSSHCQLSWRWVAEDFIYWCPVFKWLAEAWLYDQVLHMGLNMLRLCSPSHSNH